MLTWQSSTTVFQAEFEGISSPRRSVVRDPIRSESIRSVSFGESTTVDIVLRVYEILSIVRLYRLESRKNKIYLSFGRDRKIDEGQNSGLAMETAEVKHAKENGPIGITEWDLIGRWRF